MSKFQNDAIFWVDVDKIDPNPYQPRRDFNEEGLRDLAESIRQYGVLQPLTVTRNEETKDDGGLKVYYELIAGERRLRAAKMANLSQVPVTIRDEKEDAEVKLELAIIENLQREDLNPIERAEAFNQLSEEFDFTHKEIAEKIGKSREYVSNSMRLLKLPEKIKQAVIAGKITEGHTRPIMMLRDKPEKQQQLFKEVVRKELTVRETEERARRDAQDKVRKKKNKIDPETKALEEELSDTLGTRVTIEKDKEGGKLVIDFFSDEDLEGLIEMVKNNEDASMDDVMKKYASALDEDGDDKKETEQETQTIQESKQAEDSQQTKQVDTKGVAEKSSHPEESTSRTQDGQDMAETLGTMIQQARAEQENKEVDTDSDKESQQEDQLTDGEPYSTADDEQTDRKVSDQTQQATSKQDTEPAKQTQNQPEETNSNVNKQATDDPEERPSKTSTKNTQQQSTSSDQQAPDRKTETEQAKKSSPTSEGLQDKSSVGGNSSEDKQPSPDQEESDKSATQKEKQTADQKEDKKDTSTEDDQTQDELESDKADEEDDMYAVSNFSV